MTAQRLHLSGPVPALVWGLAAALLLPLAVLTLGPPLGLVARPFGLYALTSYCALLLAMMGAVHVGIAMTRPTNVLHTLAGLLPALAAWGALLVLPSTGFLIMIAAFVALFFFDRVAALDGLAPAWFAVWKMIVTAGAVVALAIAWLNSY
jgi:Protein of unknown function (DUF3429)